MAFSSWFSRFRSSSKSLFNSLLRGASSQNLGAQTSFIAKISSSQNGGRRFLLWSSSVVPFALATGSLAFQFQLQSNPSFCDDSDIHDRCVLCKLFVTLFSFVFVSVSQLAGDICVGAELHQNAAFCSCLRNYIVVWCGLQWKIYVTQSQHQFICIIQPRESKFQYEMCFS